MNNLPIKSSTDPDPIIIFPSDKKPLIAKPDGPVDLYVCRTDVFGSKLLGDRGLYHSGLLFEYGNTSWVIDLSIKGSMAALIPQLTNDGKVIVDNPIVLEYYSPESANSWQPYWDNKGTKICTISSSLYNKLIDYILNTFAPFYNRYIPFGITNKPFYYISGNEDKIDSTIYAIDNTCDKLPMRCFEWLQKEHGVTSLPFPVTRLVLSVDEKPIPITNMKDTGLVAYTKMMQNYVQAFEKIHRKDPSSFINIIDLLTRTEETNILEYVLSLDNVTQKPQWYKLPNTDVSISAEDMYFKLDNRRVYTIIIVVSLILLVIAILLFLAFKSRES